MKSKITDTGVKFSGAKKDKVRAYVSASGEKVTTVKKSTIWPEPDWASDAVDTRNPKHVYMFMHLYPKISKTPNLKRYKDPQVCKEHYIKIVETLKDCYENPEKHGFGETKFLDPDLRTLELMRILEKPLGCKNATEVMMLTIAACNKEKNLFNYDGYKEFGMLYKAGFGTDKQISTKSRLDVAEFTWNATKKKFFSITENGKIIKNIDQKVVYEFSSREDAEVKLIELLKEDWHKNKLLENIQEIIKRPMPLDNECRIGKDYRNGKDVTLDHFMETFKFSGIEWGNWVTQAERQQFLNCTFDAYSDLLNLMGLPLHFASLNGELGIAFGSRGTSNECAHFDDKEMLIHISKTKAIGSLAHEFGHAFDYVLKQKFNCPYWLSEIKTKEILRADSSTIKAFGFWADWVDQSVCIADSKAVDSKRSSKYFSTRCELFARCFEQWVQVSLTNAGQSNNFLVYGAVANPESKLSVYPRDAELEKSCDLIKVIVDSLHTSFEVLN